MIRPNAAFASAQPSRLRSMRKSRYRSLVRVCLHIVFAALAATAVVGSSALSMAAPSRSDLEAAERRLMELEKDFELVVERYNAVREELAEIHASIAAEELVVRRIERRMSVNENAAATVAEELYKRGPSEALEVVFSAESLAEIETKIEYLRSSEDAQAEVFERLEVDRQLLNEHIARLEREQQKALTAKERLTGLRAEIEAKVQGQRDEIERLTTLIERAERRRELRRQREAAAAAREAARTQEATPALVAHEAPTGALPPAAGSQAGIAVQAALSQVGKPYQWGAAGPDSYDCSGLTMWAWGQAGVSLPHNSAAQYASTPSVPRGEWQPGDLLFYGSPIHHVALYIGGGRVVEAPYTGSQVRVASAARSDYVGAGRPGV